jgi:dihydropyrimidinase
MLDLVVTGGVAVMPTAAQAADIGVVGGKIAAIGAPGSLQSVGAARIVDASDQIVIPGGIDPHIHCSMPIPFPGRNEDLLSAPPEQVSRAALWGGTTTLLDFAQCPSDQPLQRSIELRQREWAGACYCDYGFHLLLHGKLSQGVLGALPDAIDEGHASVKMFTRCSGEAR